MWLSDSDRQGTRPTRSSILDRVFSGVVRGPPDKGMCGRLCLSEWLVTHSTDYKFRRASGPRTVFERRAMGDATQASLGYEKGTLRFLGGLVPPEPKIRTNGSVWAGPYRPNFGQLCEYWWLWREPRLNQTTRCRTCLVQDSQYLPRNKGCNYVFPEGSSHRKRY